MTAEKDKKTKEARPRARIRKPEAEFDPDRPFAEGVRGDGSFFIQDGKEFRKGPLFPGGLIDG